jgi:hypothetical protein
VSKFERRLRELGLLQSELDESVELPERPDHRALLILSDAGLLPQSLSFGLSVSPDEAIGPLCARMGAEAKTLKVLDVRTKPHLELRVAFEGTEEPWDVPSVRALIHNLNDAFRDKTSVRPAVVLGEWQDALHVWFPARMQLFTLLQEPWFEPEEREALAALPLFPGS